MEKNNWKNRLNVVYSTNSEFNYETENEDPIETLPPSQQKLRINIDKRNRNGKVVTLISGFTGSEEDLKILGKTLKSKCGTGGSVKDGLIIIQGQVKEKIIQILKTMGYSNSK